MKTTLYILTIGFLLTLFACAQDNKKQEPYNESRELLPDPEGYKKDTLILTNKDSLILALTNQILTSIKSKDFKSFANFIHPVLGIRFSPYANIDTLKDVKLSADKFLDLLKKQNKIKWGSYDGSGDVIMLTAEKYFSKFVYNADYLNAEKKSVNTILGKGNSLNNLESIYNDCDFSESFFSGIDKQFEGIDWCSLRLVFKNYNNKYYLVGIVHDQWTI